jgi:hypothetical protein
MEQSSTSIYVTAANNPRAEEPRKCPKILIPLFLFGFGAFGVLVFLLRMPREPEIEIIPVIELLPVQALPLTAAGDSVCRTKSCLDSGIIT